MDPVFSPFLALLGLGPGEWVLVLLILVLLFGAAKLPELARAMGRAKGEFERGSREGREMAGKDAPAEVSAEDAKVIEAAKALGIPVEGRPIADIKKDVRTKTS